MGMRAPVVVDGHCMMVDADDVARLAAQAALRAVVDAASLNFARSVLRSAEASSWAAMATAMFAADKLTGAR